MIEHVQELGLQAELPPLSEWNRFGKRQVVVPQVRSVQPRVKAEYSRREVLTNVLKVRVASARPLAEHRWVDRVLERARRAGGALSCGWLEDADRILQL